MIGWLFGILLSRVAYARHPDFVIGGNDNPYIRRWWVLPRNIFFNIYLHEILRDDDDRALHDHPWVNVSVILDGRYVEHTIKSGGIHILTERNAGDIVFRRPKAAHRLSLVGGAPCWSLFITGPRVRVWGFHCPKGWVDWRSFTNPEDNGATVGRGCGEMS